MSNISIHALVKRATVVHNGKIGVIMISIHALVKRATEITDQLNLQQVNFNPRPREEGDKWCDCFVGHRRYFNPRPREEGDMPCVERVEQT